MAPWEPKTSQPGYFATTHWSVVLAARDRRCPEGRQAIEALCQAYWYPLYAFVRRQGHQPQDAADLTQGFFARLLEKQWLEDVDRQKGRFRSFLMVAMKHFLANQMDLAKAKKRGGGCKVIPLELETAETRYQVEPVDTSTPERVFDRQWALTVLDQVLAQLRQEYERTGRAKVFDSIRHCLTHRRGDQPYADLATGLGMTEAAVRVAVHRLRQRYRQALRDQISQTVAGPEDVDEEMRHLFEALAHG